MPSEHLNLKLNKRYMDMLKDIGNTLNMKDLSGYGTIPTLLRFCITLSHKQLKDLYNVIPTLHPDDLHILLLSIKTKKTQQYHKEKQEMKQKSGKTVILQKPKNII